MRCVVMLIGLVSAAMMLVGCEKTDPSQQPEVFNPATDPSPSYLVASGDPLLVADQREIAKRAPRASAAALAGAGSAADVEAVKQVVAEIITATATGDMEKMADFLTPPDAAAFKNLLQTTGDLETKSAALAELVKGIGGEMPKELAAIRQNQIGPPIPSEGSAANVQDEIAKLTFTAGDGKVVVSGQNIMPLTFVRSGGQWKADLGPLMRVAFTAFSELAVATGKYVDQLSSEINAHRITKSQLPLRSEELYIASVAPAMEKFMTTMLQLAGTAGGASPSGQAGGAPAAQARAAGETPAHLEAAAATWAAGDKDKAVAEFMRIDWQKPATFPEGAALGMTADKLAALPADAAQAKTAEASAQAAAIRDICNQVMKLAKNASMLGDKTGATAYLKSVTGCGQFLRDPNKLTSFQVVGEVFAKATLGTQEGGTGAAEPNAALTKPGGTAPPPAEPNVNLDSGPDKGEQLRRQLTAPARRVYGGG